ncbi:MAG: nucleotidyltransferase family protein [Promethearchaeota archaeon]
MTLEVDVEYLKSSFERMGEAVPGILSVYLFGSFARGDADESSDVDVLVVASESAGAGVNTTLQRNPDFQELETWALDLVEDGLGPLVVTPGT